jgi:hypothetical protein
MAVRLIGPEQWMGPVAVDTTATIVRGNVVYVVSGEVKPVVDGANANIAVAMDKYPDADYGGTKTKVDLVRLGEDCEVEVPFTHAGTTAGDVLAQADFGGGPFRLLATGGGTIELDSTSNGVFIPLRVGRDTKVGDKTGYLIGVFTDAASL